MVGMHGNYAPNILTNECDLLIAIGMRFDDRVTGKLDAYAKQAKIIHFEIDPAEINKNVPADVAVLGNCKESLKQLLTLVQPNTHYDWLTRFKELHAIEYEKVIKPDLQPTKEGLTMGEVLNQINQGKRGRSYYGFGRRSTSDDHLSLCQFQTFKKQYHFRRTGNYGLRPTCCHRCQNGNTRP